MLYLLQFLFTVMTVWFTHVVVSGIFEPVQKIMHNADCCSGHMALIFNLLMPKYVQEHGLHSSKSDRPSKILRASMWNGRLGILSGFFSKLSYEWFAIITVTSRKQFPKPTRVEIHV